MEEVFNPDLKDEGMQSDRKFLRILPKIQIGNRC